jgi:hypothetical protein
MKHIKKTKPTKVNKAYLDKHKHEVIKQAGCEIVYT